MGTEKTLVENPIKKELEKRGAWFLKVYAGAGMPKGVPDILALYCGRFVAFENKKPEKGAKITYVQKKALQHITDNGGIGVVPRSLSFACKVLDAIELNDENALRKLGYKTHSKKELQDEEWLEECIW